MKNDEELPEVADERIGWAYKVADNATRTEARFDAWAERYDDDVANLLNWQGPAELAKVVARYVDPGAFIHDAGAGTGLLGEILAASGYRNLTAGDLSQSMLDIAATKDVYLELYKSNLMDPLEFPDQHFEAVVSVGTSGYISGEVFKEITRIVRPRGHIIYTISDNRYSEGGFDKVVDELCAAGVLEIVEIGHQFAAIPLSDPNHMTRVHVLRRLK
jgi:predicted TPR repeat methyltransferase